MSKDIIIQQVSEIERALRQLQADINQVKNKQVRNQPIRDLTRTITRKWFEEIQPLLVRYNVSEEIIKKYHAFFDTLLSFTVTNPRKTTYLNLLRDTLQDLRKDIIPPIVKYSEKILSIHHLTSILDNATAEEQEYLTEAIKCAERNYLRASCVMGWNATINRIHKVIEKLGFEEFNKKTEEMKALSEGRFKRFKKSFNVNSISELRMIFDNDLLWVLEYWRLIDNNQHDRLSICFTMRNNCAHPGEAPLTEENLASFYSDIKVIIFDNPKFQI